MTILFSHSLLVNHTPKWTHSTTRDSFTYTDAELVGYITSLPSLPKYTHVIPLSSKYLAQDYAKEEFEDAAESMKFACQLGIQVPHIQRITQVDRAFLLHYGSDSWNNT